MNIKDIKNTKMSDIDKSWKVAGLVVLGMGILSYPAFRLYKYLAQRRKKMMEDTKEEGNGVTKSFSPAYRGHHKPHHRKAEANGHMNEGLA